MSDETMHDDAAPKRRGRQPRDGEVRDVEVTRRRRREGVAMVGGRRLPVPAGLLDQDKYDYRIVNDAPGRVRALWEDDWDVVEKDGTVGDEPGFELSGGHMHVAGTMENGQGLKTVLMRKPKELRAEDLRKKAQTRASMEQQMKAGMVSTDGRTWQPDQDVAAGGISIRHTLNR